MNIVAVKKETVNTPVSTQELKDVLQEAIRDGHRFLIKYTRKGYAKLYAMTETGRSALAADLALIGYVVYKPNAKAEMLEQLWRNEQVIKAAA